VIERLLIALLKKLIVINIICGTAGAQEASTENDEEAERNLVTKKTSRKKGKSRKSDLSKLF
jgi:hypothetical protein